MREEIVEHRLEDSFQFDRSSSLAHNKVDVSTNNNNNNNSNNMHSDIESSACQTNFQQNNNNRKFTLRPRCYVCIMRHYGSDDPDKCRYRGDNFYLDWMNTRITKCNADHGKSPKKALTFLSPPPMEPAMTKRILQANEAKAHFKE